METVKAKHEAILKSIYCLHSKSLFWLPISCIGQPSCPRLCAWLFCVPSQDTTKETIAIQDQESHPSPWREEVPEIQANLSNNHCHPPWTFSQEECQPFQSWAIDTAQKSREHRDEQVPNRNATGWRWATWASQIETVQGTIATCGDHQCLWQGSWMLGLWPKASQILLEPSHLEAVICHMRPGIATKSMSPHKAAKWGNKQFLAVKKHCCCTAATNSQAMKAMKTTKAKWGDGSHLVGFQYHYEPSCHYARIMGRQWLCDFWKNKQCFFSKPPWLPMISSHIGFPWSQAILASHDLTPWDDEYIFCHGCIHHVPVTICSLMASHIVQKS